MVGHCQIWTVDGRALSDLDGEWCDIVISGQWMVGHCQIWTVDGRALSDLDSIGRALSDLDRGC